MEGDNMLYRMNFSADIKSDEELVQVQLAIGHIVQDINNKYPGTKFIFTSEFVEKGEDN